MVVPWYCGPMLIVSVSRNSSMATSILVITLTVLASAACGFLFIPMILRFCERRGLYDLPGNRKIHRNATPRLGGLSFFPSMLVSLLVALSYVNAEGDVIVVSRWSVYFMLAVSLIFFMGIIDDRHSRDTLRRERASHYCVDGLYLQLHQPGGWY